ncbi:SRPBCC family protein [Streptomyces sp. LP11]|uniref:SRPBCC family protein n=1 Tax=Streptomyces pyxinicus TaxID=2970331 RepID=A0ABT2B5M9_9ACTN|nr:SRPBCC family protein [Streptomyces sp. LP11]MCS0603661.1 SRPBCC family protein [Streptomyces sp. LP11]
MTHLRVTRSVIAALLLTAGLLGAAAPAEAAPAMGAGYDTPSDGSLTCRGKGVGPTARVRYRTASVIHAPLSTIWRLQTDVERWPSWQQPVASAERLDHGPLRTGSAFRWTIPVPSTPTTPALDLDITSTVKQLKHGSCIRWTGPATAKAAEGLRIDGVHVWTFAKVRGGVRVSTEETHTGPVVEADVSTATKVLREGLEAWLLDLKTAAEARERQP